MARGLGCAWEVWKLHARAKKATHIFTERYLAIECPSVEIILRNI
jgi:hypothetical protein